MRERPARRPGVRVPVRGLAAPLPSCRRAPRAGSGICLRNCAPGADARTPPVPSGMRHDGLHRPGARAVRKRFTTAFGGSVLPPASSRKPPGLKPNPRQCPSERDDQDFDMDERANRQRTSTTESAGQPASAPPGSRSARRWTPLQRRVSTGVIRNAGRRRVGGKTFRRGAPGSLVPRPGERAGAPARSPIEPGHAIASRSASAVVRARRSAAQASRSERR